MSELQEKVIKSYSWDEYFMTLCYLVAMKSKDPSTKVGSVIVGPDNEIITTGYNGLPRGFADTDERYTRPYKYQVTNHAEENALLHCARIGVSAKSCRLYVPWVPCSSCAKSIVQAGITEVIFHKEWPGNSSASSKWYESIKISRELFAETGVNLREFSGKLIDIKGHYHDDTFILETH